MNIYLKTSSHNPVTNPTKRYRQAIADSYEILNRHSGLEVENQWLMQDGAPPHTANATMSTLKETFGDRLISKKANFAWALRSPDMNPLDFFLWGYCKQNVYKNKPTNVADLKTEIENFLAEISVEMCARVVKNFQNFSRIQEFQEFSEEG